MEERWSVSLSDGFDRLCSEMQYLVRPLKRYANGNRQGAKIAAVQHVCLWRRAIIKRKDVNCECIPSFVALHQTISFSKVIKKQFPHCMPSHDKNVQSWWILLAQLSQWFQLQLIDFAFAQLIAIVSNHSNDRFLMNSLSSVSTARCDMRDQKDNSISVIRVYIRSLCRLCNALAIRLQKTERPD